MAERLHQETADLNQQQHDPPQPNNILDPQLYSAAKGRDVDEFIRALESHCIRERVPLPIVLGLRSPLGNTLLHAAAENGDHFRAIIDFIPKHLISCKNSRGETPLHIAARAGIVDVVELLLHRGGLTCTDHNGNSALHEAVRNRNYVVIRQLVNEDPNPLYRQNKESKSPWCLAVETKDIDVLRILLAVPNDGEDQRRSETKGVFGMSPVHLAIMYRNKVMLEEMHDRKPWLFQLRDSGQGTPLHLAAYIDYLEGVKFLMQHYRTDALEQDSTDGYLPIHVACMMGHLGQNILHVSVQHGHLRIVRYILSNPNFSHLINARDLEGNTPLHVTAMHYQPSVLLLARDRRIDPSLVNNNNMTALDVWLMFAILRSAGTQKSKELAICEPTGRRPQKQLGLLDPSAFKEKVSCLLVVATLIASVTFVSGFSVPGGYYGSDPNAGFPILLHKAMYNVFVISNSTAMYGSIMTIVTLLWILVSDPSVTVVVVHLSTIPLLVALTAMPLAFMAGVYGTVTKLDWLSRCVLVQGSLALFIISCTLVLLQIPPGLKNPLSDGIVFLGLFVTKKISGSGTAGSTRTPSPLPTE
ncbi:hypothetical protein EUGRSUZ_K00058 [Eucalyptus grandis]|uniref:PGG domain-containing protein n=2 Tax=Eucalyptus grandis TaxID=71139 RepID=A0A058ZYL2_EUCGR|nr:hypothetical protein EUGRSUZ_K00058 [Eucalyptus grandis]